MNLSLTRWVRTGFGPAAAIFLALAAGCSSEPTPRGRGAEGPRPKPPAPMAGQDSFFDGKILAEIHVGTEGMPEVQRRDGDGRERDGSPRGERRGGGGRRVGMQGGAGGVAGNVGGGMPFGEGGRQRRAGGGPEAGVRPLYGSGGRPVMIHLRFTNHGPAAIQLSIPDFVSPLGNFAVRPEKLSLEPGQSLETDPMTSQLAGAFSEIPATLVLRLDGKTEKKNITLRAVPDKKPED